MPTAHAAARAVFVVFAASGFAFASWASRLPAVRDGLSFSEQDMGLLLLTGSIGSVAAIPLSGLVAERIGTARTVLSFAGVLVVGLTVAGFGVALGEHLAVRLGLVLFGVGAGVWDAAMNLEGAAVEQRLGRAVMPVFHAGFSFGTVLGAGIGALVATLGVPVLWHVVAAGVLALGSVLVAIRYFSPTVVAAAVPDGAAVGTDGADPAAVTPPPSGVAGLLAAWREPRTLAIGLVVLASALTEGVANDWVSLAVVDGFGTSDGTGAVGLAVFLTAMTTARLAGTRAIDRFGRVPVLVLSALLAFVGVLTFALVPFLWLALVGVALWGLGAAMGFPMGMSAASDDPRRAAMRVAAVSTIAYTAFFVGPPLIGFVAHSTGYRLAVLVLLVPMVLGLAVARSVRPLPSAAGVQRRV
ncbi:MFS transporter [Promicromonospora thailandica]|uniref:Cyanate permease n=1 Tax=Promicromonospora thailandica TaxID=765201 RepID=A0A9X2GA56_9MICO|nr:MFS transporter [Promicromonospora thailandica]MCP2264741.1 Cyanate permease [Promicromonospora thailandica]BFF19017.1 MFS transporter [Promicromonospora thailandica]